MCDKSGGTNRVYTEGIVWSRRFASSSLNKKWSKYKMIDNSKFFLFLHFLFPNNDCSV